MIHTIYQTLSCITVYHLHAIQCTNIGTRRYKHIYIYISYCILGLHIFSSSSRVLVSVDRTQYSIGHWKSLQAFLYMHMYHLESVCPVPNSRMAA